MVATRLASIGLIGLLSGGAHVTAPRLSTLRVTRVSVLQRGLTLQVRDTVRNAGRARVARSTTGYYLAQVRIGDRRVGRLLPGASSSGSASVRIPPSFRPGSYHLRACADDHHGTRQTSCRLATQPVLVPDRTPPTFAGLSRATTCIPGPVGGPVRSSPYWLRWAPATDDTTPASEIVYDIYQASAPGGEDLTVATYTSRPGATSFTTPQLSDNAPYYFIVRARDRAGNRDVNTLERQGMNLCV
jgi:hypothetical protein